MITDKELDFLIERATARGESMTLDALIELRKRRRVAAMRNMELRNKYEDHKRVDKRAL